MEDEKENTVLYIYRDYICVGVALYGVGRSYSPNARKNVDYELDARLFLKHGNWTPMLELEGQWQYDPNQFYHRHLTAGIYYELQKISRLVDFTGFRRAPAMMTAGSI